MEDPDPPDTVALSADSHLRHRPGPVFSDGEGVFQPAISGKYDNLSELSVPDYSYFYYQNVRGLRTKIDQVFLTTHDTNFDVIFLTETGLDDKINSLQLFGTSFNVFRCDRNPCNSNKSGFGGGVLIAIAQRYPSTIVQTVNGNHLEQVCVNATIRGIKLMLCCLYIPPDKSRNADIIDAHISSVGELCDKCPEGATLVVCGDFNQPHIVWELGISGSQNSAAAQLPCASAALLDGINFLNLSQMNTQRNYLGRLLDLVLCSTDCLLSVDCCTTPLLPVDPHHPPLEISLPVRRRYANSEPAECDIPKLNYRKIDFASLMEYLHSIDWDTFFVYNDTNRMARQFCDTISSWLCSNLPFVKRPATPAWCTPRLRQLKRERNCAQRAHRRWKTPLTQRNFKRSSNDYRRLNSALYSSYVLRVQTDLRRQPKKFWNFVNSKRKCSSIPGNVYYDGVETKSNSESCELFANFFASVFAAESATDLDAEIAAADVPACLVDLGLFNVTPELVMMAAKKLKRSFCAGPDGIPAVVLNQCVSVLAQPLCSIFNKSFEQGIFPDIWKQSFMFPVYKAGDRHNVRNYRGITSLSAASKLFEIIVSDVIKSRTKNYISTAQHGFMPGRSVCTNLLEFTSSCISHMEQKKQVDVIYTDLKAAFDRIDHVILLRKLSRLGVSDQLVNWLKSYLCERILRVKLGTSISSRFTNKSGVPQGSNLGPLLFVLYINDVALLLGVGCKLVYADDLKLFLAVSCLDDCRRLQVLLDIFTAWCCRNRLIISVAKCEVMTFHRMKNPLLFDYRIDGIELRRVDHVSDLGVLLDAKLSFNAHREAVVSKATRQLGFISKIGRNFTDPHCLKALYCSLVRPLLENCSLVWFPPQLTWNLRIERVQRRFIRLALRNLPWRNPENLPPYINRCRLLDLETLEYRRKIQQVVFVAKVLNGEIDSPKLLSLIGFRASQRTLRTTGLLQTPFHRTAFGSCEPITACMRTFSRVEDIFDFNEPSHKFKQKLHRSSVLL